MRSKLTILAMMFIALYPATQDPKQVSVFMSRIHNFIRKQY